MHIAIDTTSLATGHKDRGIGTYTKELIRSLQKYEKKHSYSFFVRGEKVPENIDLVHYPYFDHFFLTLPLQKPKPTVVTVHDLIPFVFPDKFPRGLKGTFTWQIQKFSLRGATRVITNSQQTSKDLVRFTDFPRDKIDTIHLAPSKSFRKVNRIEAERIKRKYHLPDTFILYVGDVNWNKNILGLLTAFQNLKTSLVLVGSAFNDGGLFEMQQINELTHALRLDNVVKKLGFVPEEDLVGIYNLATVCIEPSFYEGFGLPVLEAMACGCPVVCSYAGSLKEIGGPAISVDPYDPKSISSGILYVLSMHDTQREELIKKGIVWAAQFSWKKVAAETVASYEKALA
ncbi:glycosyltransferase family 4 protein [Candidatus Gottesmanbacteria bacterium]|nr:glycosyltransferase family 4 protein [Candidatus Gottesmanbacteria bacterium]